ncbi:hypothetical protein ACI4WJ_001542 [Klebsiella aerogenes]
MRDLILQLSKSSIYSTKPNGVYQMNFSAQYARINAATPVTAGEVRSVLTIAVSAE